MTRLIDRVRLRLRSLFRRDAVEAELQRELALHLDEQIDEYVATGMTPVEARAAAMRAFGPIARIGEECRDTRRVSFVHNLLQDLRYTLRSLRTQPLLLAAATLSIGVAVGANATIFNLANELLLVTPTTYRPDRLVNIRAGYGSHVSYHQWLDLERSGALAGLAGYQIEAEVNWRGPEQAISVTPLIVTANFFDVLGVPVALGRGFTAAEAQAERHPTVAVISSGFWTRRLGHDPNILGRTLILNGEPYTVLGVLPEGLHAFPGYGVAPEIYLPVSQALMPGLDNEHHATAQLVGRLYDNQTLDQGRAALAAAAANLTAVHGKNFATLQQFSPVGGLGGSADFQALAAFFAVLLVAVALVLLVACANVAGLLLSRSAVRRREIAIRVALGAGRPRLIQQLLTEGLWIALLGAGCGLVLMLATTSLLGRVRLPLPLPIELQAGVDGRLFLYLTIVIGVTTLCCGLVPAIQATRPSLVPALKQEEPRYIHRRWTLRGVLVIGQVAVSLVLLLTAMLFLRNLGRATHADPGFDVSHTIVAQLSFVEGRYSPASRAALLESAVEQLRSSGETADAAYTQDVPLTLRSGMTTGTELRVAEGGDFFRALYEVNRVGPRYFSTMGIALDEGREFQKTDGPGTPTVAIINREFARRYIPGINPIGRHLMLPGAEDKPYPAEIVGIVADSRHRTIGEDQKAAVYEPFLQRGNRDRFVQMVVRVTGDPAIAVKSVASTLTGLDNAAAVDVRTMRSALSFAFLPSQVGAVLLGTLGGIGLLLAMVGLFAIISYSVSRRTAEIGIRVALGASRQAVLRLLLTDVGVLAGTGIALGLLVSTLVTRPLGMFLVVGLSPHDPMAFAVTTALFCLVTIVATWQPARRALGVNPARALHE